MTFNHDFLWINLEVYTNLDGSFLERTHQDYQMPGERQIRGQEVGKLQMRRAFEGRGDVQEMGSENRQGLAKNKFGLALSKAKIEAGNDVARTTIDAACGYRDFERFGKRFLLMRWNAKR